MRGLDEARRERPSRRVATETAATRPRNDRRESVIPASKHESENEARPDADGAGLVREEADARARAALLIESQIGRLVRDVVDEQRRVPLILQETDAQVHDVVRRQLRIERERVLRVRTADVV